MGILDDFVGMLLRAAYEHAFDDFTRLLGEDAMKPSGFTMLTLIVNNPGITQVEIGRAASRDKSSVTKLLRQMELDGIITRVRLEEDRRSYASYVTDSGAELHQRMEEKALAHIARLDSVIGQERKAALLEILRDLIQGLSRERFTG